uniref:Protein kinase domain-containing protein n=1 Tax=Guillardia theta TaxID=55529 RepID=A0A7S4L0S1_GUITH|mmetsp:Transcript_35239/g.110093  ORF Transcript_35239/g.110093 Transcript_35239/m.110093 type:complete len:854 (+) Transcript_35239:279-2840(+)
MASSNLASCLVFLVLCSHVVSFSLRPSYLLRPSSNGARRTSPVSLRMQVRSPTEAASQSLATSAAIAAAAVNAAVSMRKLEAPDVDKTYIVKDKERQGAVDEEGLPIVYDKELIEAYWRKQDGALQKRWREFLSVSVPFLTKMITMLVRGGVDELKKNEVDLAREARQNLEKLGPTYIKAGQMMSVRPDVLPQPVLDELAYLQDSVKPFDTKVAVEMIEQELKAPLGKYFSEISEKPVAAASLAQVYKAKLVTGETVAVKVQRPDVLSVVSKDLYVLRRAAEVYQGLMDRFAPQQRTNYVALLNEWAVGFYTELDFMNECANQKKLKGLLEEQMVEGMYVPEVYEELCTRRLLVTEWVDGVKLSECSPEEIREVIGIGQESFLTQLLQVGFFHSDPHPGNIIRMSDESKGKIALIDFGLVACLQQEDMDQIVNAIIHLANKDYPALVDDFISLGILPPDCDRPKVIPLMDKALSPYVKGGGAKKYEEELKRMYGMDGSSGAAIGGFQAMTQDALTVLNDIPFTIPPYFALIARAVVTLEGVALIGDPSYGLVMEAYPFVARKLLREDRPEVQRALQEVLYAGGGLKTSRLSVLLNGALGVVARTQGGAFIDFDSIPEEGVPLEEAIKYLLSDKARSLRNILADEVENAADVLLRQSLRKGFSAFLNNLPRPPFISSFLPSPETVPTMFLLPTASGTPQPVLRPPQELLEVVAPKLTREEELYAISLVDLIKSALGEDAATLVAGDALVDPRAASRLLLSVVSTGKLPGWSSLPAPLADALKQLLTVLNGGSVRREEEESQESSAGGWQTNLQEVLGTLEKLEEKERQELNDVVQGTGSRLWQRMLNRLETLSS